MKYLFINSVYGVRSTGKIISTLCHQLANEGHECMVAYGRESIADDIKTIRIGTPKDVLDHVAKTRLFDYHGLASKKATMDFVKEIEKYGPDVIWLHNLHGYYINYEVLFSWFKKHPSIEIRWTLHDCWAFTGHCTHFTIAKCYKWKSHCFHCPQKKEYPSSYLFDSSKTNFLRKKKAFSGVKNMTIITPSEWLAGLVKQSFLREYPVKVINNIIDTKIFKATESEFRQKNGLNDKQIVLCVSVGWERTKGFQDIIKLREYLDDSFVIVMVGVTKKQKSNLPNGIIGIERTSNQSVLAGLYTTSNVFVNPTHQDNYPTVNLEARACGTPVVTYNVGGSPESAGYAHVVQEGDIEALAHEIKKICIPC